MIPTRVSKAIALGALIAALVVSNFTTSTAQNAAQPADGPTRVLEGNYRVAVDCLFADGTTKSDRVEQVKRIEFHSEYIMVIDHNEAGRVVPVRSIKAFEWQPS